MKKFKKRILAQMLILGLIVLPYSSRALAYETGIHYYLTYLLGHWCGLGSDADTIALADYSVDLLTQTNAGSRYNQWLDPKKESTRRIFHFVVPKDTHATVKRGSKTAWEAIAEKIEGHPVLPTEILDPAYRAAFKATAIEVRAYKDSI
jgi:hypothetical protein